MKIKRVPSQEIKVQQDADAGEGAPQPCGCACVYPSVPPSSFPFMSLRPSLSAVLISSS